MSPSAVKASEIPEAKYIYKLFTLEGWERFQATQKGSDLDERDGYLHFSSASQVKNSANKHFPGYKSLVLVKIPIDLVKEHLKWEKNPRGNIYPHLYSKLEEKDIQEKLILEVGRFDYSTLEL